MLTPQIQLGVFYVFKAYRDGNPLWEEEFHNLVPDAALTDLLNSYLYQNTWYLGLISGSPSVASTDTMLSHPGWTEVTDYANATRPDILFAETSSTTINNLTFEHTFTITALTVSIGGGMICSDATKGGTAGLLFSAGTFDEGSRTLAQNDTLKVTVYVTGTSA